MRKFTVGQTLTTTSICNSDVQYIATVIKRTAKTITINENDEIKTRRIFTIGDDCERIRPHGSYSMAAVFRA